MNSNNLPKKNSTKKFNLIFFLDTEKTYHFKFNYLLLKIFLSFIVIVFIFSIFSLFFSVHLYKKNLGYESYITAFKKSILEYYLDKDKLKSSYNTASISENIKDDSEKLKITEITNENPNQTKAENNQVINEKSKANISEKVEEKSNVEVNIITNSSVGIENQKIIQELSSSKISFSLANLNQGKSSISGNVCAVIIGVNSKNENIIYKIPDKLEINYKNIPFSCKEGKKVRFSRLRPTEFLIEKGKEEFLIKQVNIYFSYSGLDGIILNSFNN